MTKEEKELLLKDLCARLPYGVMLDVPIVGGSEIKKLVSVIQEDTGISCVTTYSNEERDSDGNLISCKQVVFGVCDVLPYLRPMSSMTEEEYTEYRRIQGRNCDYSEATICVRKSLYTRSFYDDNESIKITVYYPNPVIRDWLNAHHFDYHGLIDKGLALEAPEGMYNTKNE